MKKSLFLCPTFFMALAILVIAGGNAKGIAQFTQYLPIAVNGTAKFPPHPQPTFGVILVGPKNDHGWNQAHYEGGLFVEAMFPGSQMFIYESLNPADKPATTLEDVVDDMVAEGASLIFTTSDEFEEETVAVAKIYPNVIFINVTGDDAWQEGHDAGLAPSNLGNIMGRMVDIEAIAGCAAALQTQTGKIGYLGPLINFQTRRLAAAAFLGARYCYENIRGMNPDDLEFTVKWIGF
jgi:simple sugar transport system substrate-binding protein